MAGEAPKKANELAGERTDLAVERTVMAAGRSLMSWISTALPMISLGFAIYEFLRTITPQLDIRQASMQGRRLGLTLIALGVVSVLLGTLVYFGTLKRMNRLYEHDYRPYNYEFFIGVAVVLLGLFLFVTILTHTEAF